MKRSHRIAIGVATSLGLGLGAAAVFAQPGQMGGGMGHGPMGAGHAGQMGGHQLMTTEEQAAFREKMQSAKTPEERQQIAEANRTEMQKRAKEKGITLPEPHGPHAGFGPHFAPATK
jgi:Spy/CpxP family protein refolding chaperone